MARSSPKVRDCFAAGIKLSAKDAARIEKIADTYNTGDITADYISAVNDVIAEDTALRDAIKAQIPEPKVVVKKKRIIVKPSVDGTEGTMHTKESLEDSLTSFMDSNTLGKNVIVVDSAAELDESLTPEQIDELISMEKGGKRPVAIAVSGRAYLIADRIAVGKERAVFLHEVGGHLGLERILSKEEFKRIVTQIIGWAKRNDGSPASEIALRAYQRMKGADTADNQRASEMLAYFIEEAVNAGIDPTAAQQMRGELANVFRALWAAFKTALRRLRINTEALTPQDVVDMAYGAAKLNIYDAKHGSGAKFYKFDPSRVGQTGTIRGWGFYFTESDDGAAKFADMKGETTGDKVIAASDFNVREDEWLDHDAKVFQQSSKIRDALLGLMENLPGITQDSTGKQLYDALAEFEGSRKIASESLDRVGIKGAKYSTAGTNTYVVFNRDSIVNATFNPNNRTSEKVQFTAATDKLKRWFGNSKVVNDDGTPMVVYHGTDGEDFSVFTHKNHQDRDGGRQRGWVDYLGKVYYFSPSSREASAFALNEKGGEGARVVPAYLKMEAPLDMRVETGDAKRKREFIDNVLPQLSEIKKGTLEFWRGIASSMSWKELYNEAANKLGHADKANDVLRGMGYDGIIDKTADMGVQYAVFEPTQIKSAIGNNGEYNPRDSRMQFSVAAPSTAQSASPVDIERTIQKSVPAPLRPAARTVARVLNRFGRKALNTISFTEDLLNRAVQYGLTSAKTYHDLNNQRAAFVGHHERVIDAISNTYNDLPEEVKGKGPGTVNEFLYDSTRAGLWAYKPAWDSNAKVDPDLAARFGAMPDAAQQFIQSVFQHGHEMLQTKKQTVLDTTASEYDARIADAKKNNPESVAALEKEKGALLKKFTSLFKIKESGPYAPIKRFGKFVVLARSDEYLAAERAGDTKLIEKLQSDENHRYVDFVDSDGQADEVKRRLIDSGIYSTTEEGVVARERELVRNEIYTGSGTMAALGKLRAQIDADYGGDAEGKKQSAAAKQLQDMIAELYLTALADESARKSEIKRKNIAGDIDMVRAFETQGRADANFLGAVKYGDETMQAINKMRRESKVGGRQKEKSELFNEILNRYVQSLTYDESPVVDKLTRMTSIWFLSTSPSYYIQNATQPWMMSMPAIAGKHGYGSTGKALYQAYKDVAEPFKDAHLFNEADFESLIAGTTGNLEPEERQMLKTLLDSGRIDIGFSTELGKFRIEGEGKVTDTWNKVDRSMRHMQTKLEALNRAATALAAFRLEHRLDPDKAVAYADRIVQETHGDYSRYNSPRAFNTGFGKVALQFRKFQLIQLTLLAKMLHNSYAGASVEERAVARKAVAYTLSHAFAIGGVKAMPAFATISWVLAKAFGEDDEPPEYIIRRAIGNQDIADLLLNGPISKATGVNVSGFGSMGNVISIAPYTDFDFTSRKGVSDAAFAIFGGPLGGLTARAADGVGYLNNGQIGRGLENLLPKGFASAFASYRIATEGTTKRSGDQTMSPDELNALDIGARAFGFQPQKLTDMTERQNAAYRIDQALQSEAKQLKQKYSEARKDRDNEAAAEIRAKWMELQKRRVEKGFDRKPLSDLLKAPSKQAEREKNTAGGVQYRAGSRDFAESLANQ